MVGYGNIGQYVVEALEAAPDFEIAGIVRRSGAENKPAELEAYAVVKDIKELKDVDVAVLATPTRSVEKHTRNGSPVKKISHGKPGSKMTLTKLSKLLILMRIFLDRLQLTGQIF